MTALALTLALALGGADSLAKQTLGGLTFKAPTQWEKTQPGERVRLCVRPEDVTVFPVDPQRPAKTCVNQMVEALGTEGFTSLTLGAQPASKKVTTDFVGEGEEAKTDANKVTTTSIVGCNGKTKWVMTWTSKTAQGARFGPILKRVMDSIGYGK
jgi:hypothetical protein